MNESPLMFYPESHPSVDRLNRRPFARLIARGLIDTSNRASFAIGIESEWGTGKSTLLRYILEEIQQNEHTSKPLILEFSPWLVSGFSSLLESFFLSLAQILALTTLPNGEKAISASNKVIKYLALLEHAKYLKYVPGTGAFGSIAEDVSAWAKEATRAGDEASKQIQQLLPKGSVEGQKKAVEAALRDLNRNVVVVIDDIDRLQADEIRQIFQLVKAIGSLDGTRYLLTYDAEVVANALTPGRPLSDGLRFLEKIVQIQYRLPATFPWQLHGMLVAEIEQCRPIKSLRSEQGRFEEAVAVASMLFTKARDVLRLVNKLSLSLPATAGAVDEADVIVYESLDLLFPSVTQAIRLYPRYFVGADFDSPVDKLSKDLSFHEFADEAAEAKESDSGGQWLRFLPSDEKPARAVRRALYFLFARLLERDVELEPGRLGQVDVLQRLLLVTGHPDLFDGGRARDLFHSPNRMKVALTTTWRNQLVSTAQQLSLHAEHLDIEKVPDLTLALSESYEQIQAQDGLNPSEAAALSDLQVEFLRRSVDASALLLTIVDMAPLYLAHDVVLEMAQEHGLWKQKSEPTLSSGNRLVRDPNTVLEAIKRWRDRVFRAPAKEILAAPRPFAVLFRFDQLSNDSRTAKAIVVRMITEQPAALFSALVNSDGRLKEEEYLELLPSVEDLKALLVEKSDWWSSYYDLLDRKGKG